jgi:hypothetical protein
MMTANPVHRHVNWMQICTGCFDEELFGALFSDKFASQDSVTNQLSD